MDRQACSQASLFLFDLQEFWFDQDSSVWIGWSFGSGAWFVEAFLGALFQACQQLPSVAQGIVLFHPIDFGFWWTHFFGARPVNLVFALAGQSFG